jgi:hypothetical protein
MKKKKKEQVRQCPRRETGKVEAKSFGGLGGPAEGLVLISTGISWSLEMKQKSDQNLFSENSSGIT